MRQLIAPAALVLALTALVVMAPAEASAQAAKVTPMSHDFGNLKQMQTVHTSVTVTNAGAGRLHITNVEADCGCTVPSLSVTNLGPGESTEIEIEFNSKHFDGKVHKVVHINTNDPLNSVIDVMLTANVYAPLIITPSRQRVGFDRSLEGEAKTERVTFLAKGDTPLEISVGKTRKDLFDVNVINALDGDSHMSALEVTRPASMGPGRHRDNVRVTTNVPDMPTVDIEMQAWVATELTASPEHIAYRFKKNLNQSIRVAPFRKGLVFKVTKVACDLPEISIEVVETMPNAVTTILLTGTPITNDDPRVIAAKGRILGTVSVYTNNQDAPVLTIPVSYMVRM